LPVPGTDGVPVPSYGFMIMLSFVVGTLLAMRWAKARGIRPMYIADLALAAMLGGVSGARLLCVIEHWHTRFAHLPWRQIILPWDGGLTFYGGLVGGTLLVLATICLRKLDWRELTDILSPHVVLGLALTRVGCFLNGCCFGRTCPANHPLAVVFPAHS